MNLFQRLSYTALNFPTSAAGMPIFIFILPFYADDLGLGLSLVVIIFFLGRFTDILTDPVMGLLIDKFPSRWGKHKHWILLSTPIFMFATFLIFLPQTSSPSWIYFFIGLFMLYLAFTLSTITQLSWATYLAPDYDERTRLLTLRELMALLGMFSVIAIPAIVEISDPTLQAKVNAIGIFVLFCIPLITINAVFFTPDSSSYKSKDSSEYSFSNFLTLFIPRIFFNRLFWNIRHSELNYQISKKMTIFLSIICGLFSRVVPKKIIYCSEKSVNFHEKHHFYNKNKIWKA